MMKAYGKYAQERDASWKVLADNEISYLPVDVIKIACRNGIKVIRNVEVNVLKSNQAGLCALKNGKWYIVYDETMSNEEKRYTIAHELGHIFLGHPKNYEANGEYDYKKELAADSFATKLLTPLCILKELEVTQSSEIQKLCDVPFWVAAGRIRRLKLIQKRNMFYTSPFEMMVRARFDKFIKNERKTRGLGEPEKYF